jgi:ribosomal protein S18 acetylase RimI-like enzyme
MLSRQRVKEETMNELDTLIHPQVHLEQVDLLRLPELFDIDEQAAAPCWSRQDFLAAFRLDGVGVALAMIHDRALGFALYQAAPSEGIGMGGINRLLRYCWLSSSAATTQPYYVDLLRIAVLPEWQHRGIGRALLEQLRQEFRPLRASLQALVPESNLSVQLFLRNAGYKAVRILPLHFGSEDGYLMERPCG